MNIISSRVKDEIPKTWNLPLLFSMHLMLSIFVEFGAP